jgi:hypothetical protein
MTISHTEIKSILRYEPDTGEFYWRIARGHANPGDIAGNDTAKGYRSIGLNGRQYLVHRVVWFFEKGEWPKGSLDHINGIKHDNRIENLREATRSQNGANRGKEARNTSGFKGVSWYKQNKRWMAHIKFNGKCLCLGYFDDPEEAHHAYKMKALELFGDFARSE